MILRLPGMGHPTCRFGTGPWCLMPFALGVLGAAGCVAYDVPEQPDLSALVDAYEHPSAEVDVQTAWRALEESRLDEEVGLAVLGLDLAAGVDRVMEQLDPLIGDPHGEDGSDRTVKVGGVRVEGSGSVHIEETCERVGERAAQPGAVDMILSIRESAVESVASGRFRGCWTRAAVITDGDQAPLEGPWIRLDGDFAVDLGGTLAIGERIEERWLTFRFDGRAQLEQGDAVDGELDFRIGPGWLAVRLEIPGAGHAVKALRVDGSALLLQGASTLLECSRESKSCTGSDGASFW
jgi:hypothetical protein